MYRTGDALFLNYSKTLTMVWTVNFALGAVTGTIVEFGLLDIWPTSILLFSSSAFIPLLYEATIAFIGEAVLVVLFLIAIGRWRARYTLSILIAAWLLGSLSGYFILTANAWMNVPWGGMGGIPHALYPFLPSYGPDAANLTATLNLAALLLHYTVDGTGSVALTSTNFTSLVGTYLTNPWLPMVNPDAVVTTLHTLFAAYAIGVGAVALAISIRFFRTHDSKYTKLLKPPLLWILAVVLLIELIVLGHFMGDAVVTYQPPKFTALTTLTGGPGGVYGYEYYDPPVEALFAYGNPYHPLYGFQYYLSQCRTLGNTTFGQLYGELDPGMLSYLGPPLANVTLAQNCEAAVLSLEPLAPLVSVFYYTMIGAGILLAIAAVLALFTYLVRAPILSAITDFINNEILGVLIGADNVMPFLASAMAVLSAIAATAGWAAREVGRQPWTVYGLITTNEVVTSDAITPGFVAFVVAILLTIAVVGALAMYYVATRPSLLDRVRELAGGVGGHE
ncbi:cytochrome ubiquinol oxidase subunit I [Vulcanisaeta distributa]|uniref:cytochrome ubiquinol oxidase subunit I n=1 Tax=Vulcanisaeta distributa TaxID=164451 RepID=UPI000B16EFC4|nr:cytochrome ubiquinol oxidase subunit I [Vulcanisaeta distributa]